MTVEGFNAWPAMGGNVSLSGIYSRHRSSVDCSYQELSLTGSIGKVFLSLDVLEQNKSKFPANKKFSSISIDL